MARILANNPYETQMRPSGPEFIDLDEITWLDDPEFTTPMTGLPTYFLAQLENTKASGRTSVSNPLSDMIKIYDDDESPEVSLVTLVHIEEEKEPKKTSSPVPDTQAQGIQWSKQEIESVLDTQLPNALETQENSSKDDQGSGKSKEGDP